LFDDFFKGQGPARIFVYHQTPYKINESKEIIDMPHEHPQFYVTHGDTVKLKGKGVYFVRTTQPGKGINVSAANDNEVMFGEISENTVTSLDSIINKIYRPLV